MFRVITRPLKRTFLPPENGWLEEYCIFLEWGNPAGANSQFQGGYIIQIGIQFSQLAESPTLP